GDMRHFFTDEHVAFFKNEEELVQKAISFQRDDAKRRAVASAGRVFYHEHFSGQRIVKFMVETTLGIPFSRDYLWSTEVYR
ncbi:MAG: glycosyltransferase, partial [Pontiellaceae bacterium]|nr:glycosyltransferase [Pontiellaceae bacterium]